MTFNRRFHPIIVTTLILANLLSPNAPLLRAQDGTSVWLPLVRQVDGLSNALPATDLLFRTAITVQDPAQWARLSELAVPILHQEGDRAVILADYDQLQTLARLRYQPHNSIEFGALVNASAAQKPWLARSLQPLTDQLGAVRTAAAPTLAQAALTQDAQAALTTLRAAANQLSSEQRAGLAALPTLDDDGDDLTNTEESWWCTDPLNPNSDGDAKGYSDGQEVAALLDVTLSRTVRWGYGPPFGPPAAWPNFNNNDSTGNKVCNDGDRDTIPDYAEAFMVGTRPTYESTDNDKFDDGQELFGITYCPGGDTGCGEKGGTYPRSEYWNFIKASMPNWVLPPGDSPFVAAFPVPEVYVEPSSWTVERVTRIETIEGEMTQQSHSYETAVTRGQSTSIANTVTWNEWEEVSQAVERPLIYSSSSSSGSFVCGGLCAALIGAGATVIIGGISALPAFRSAAAAERQVEIAEKQLYLMENDTTGKDTVQELQNIGKYTSQLANNVSTTNERLTTIDTTLEVGFQNIGQHLASMDSTLSSGLTNVSTSLDGVRYAINQQGALLSRGLYNISYAISQPRLTETRTNGKSWGGAQTTTHEEYEEHTVSEGEAFTTGKNWETAWAVDSSHAADLTFRYTVQNSGTEYARELSGLIFNIYIGDDKLPTISYPAWEQFPNGKLENLFPVGPNTPSGTGSSKTFASTTIPLSLETMKRIDLGERLTVKVESYSYGADELFYTDAVSGGVTVFVEDGVEDGDETVDRYVIPTWGVESVAEVLTRYFPADYDAEGKINALWTPEFSGIADPVWHEHYLSDIAWWNVYMTQSDGGNSDLTEQQARAGSGLLFRFNRDSDRDGYNDRAEFRYYCALPTTHVDHKHCADAHLNATIHPQPELLAGYVTEEKGDVVTVKLALENTGTFDAYGIDAVLYSPDDTTTIGNNTIGGNGRVRPGQSVTVGSLIQAPNFNNWGSSTAKTYAAGQFSGAQDRTFTFAAETPGVVGSGSTSVRWNDGNGQSGLLDLGSNYHAPLPLDVAQGVQIGFNTGTIAAGASFSVGALTPRDTFTFTVNSRPYTPPVIVVSYSDPQGSHRLITPVQLSAFGDTLAAHAGAMLDGIGLQIVTPDALKGNDSNITHLVVNSPHPVTIKNGYLHLNFVSDGKLVLEQSHTLDFSPGPTTFAATWRAADFSADYNPNGDNLLIAFWTDSENNIIDSTARPLPTFAVDPRPAAASDATAWNFGTVTQGELLHRTIALASVGDLALLGYVSSTPGLTVAQIGSKPLNLGDVATYALTLDTRVLPTGPYSGTIILRTSDPNNPRYTMPVTGMIEPLTGDAYARSVDDRPLDMEVWVPGVHDRGDLVQFSHSLDPNPDQIHPVKVFSQDERLLGMGEHAISFADSTTLVGGYGTGVDGDIEINTDTTFSPARTALAQTTQPGQATVELVNATGFDVGEEILLLQVQGEQAGIYEFARIYLKTNNQLTLYRGLSNPFTQSGSAKVQVIQVPNYRNVKITSTGRWRAPAWNGNDGGVIIFRAAESLLIEAGGLIDATGSGFRGTAHGPVYRHQTGVQGEGYSGNGSQTWSANGNGGGGGQGSQDGGGGGGGGHATAGANGVTGQPNSRSGGSGGQSVGTPNLRQWFFGGAGGEGGADEDGGNPGGGGNGGGIIALFAKAGIVNGSIYSNGTSGGNGCQGCGGGGSGMAGGGGGAGGTIFMQGFDLTLNSPVLQVSGGAGGYGYERGGHGGSGAAGRIHAEYCGTLTGPVVPLIDQSVISCAIAYQANTLAPSGTNLIIPEHFSAGQQFRIQYGQKLDFAAAGGLTTLLRVPAGNWTSATLDALVSGVGTGEVTLKVDVGNNGTWDWEESRSVNDATTFSSPNLAAAFAPYVTGAGEKMVEVKVYLSKPGQLLLTNMAITRDRAVELAPSFALGGTSTEGDMVPFTTTVANRGAVDSGPLTVSYYATRNAQSTPQYIGSAFIANIPPNSSEPAPFAWHTLGFTGPVTVTALVDPYNRLVESDETNNSRSGQLTILTRPDLTIPAVTLSNREPLVGERVEVSATLSNRGQTLAGAQSLALYRNHPDGGGTLLQSQRINSLAATTASTVTFTWTPDEPGLHRLYLRSDGEHSINEFDESNNDNWLDVYVGAPSPLTVDSGAVEDKTYSTVKGFGVLDLGEPDETGKCGDAAYQTFRRDPTGKVAYRFDHLLPGHFYHLDLVLYECGQNYGRQQSVSVDGLTIAGPIDLGSGKVETRSLLLDPALYADGTISVTVSVAGSGGALVNQIALVDVDYRYADAGGEKDQPYPSGMRPYGWLDGVHQTPWGKLPYQSLRENQAGAAIRYRFDALAPAKEYQVHFSFFQGNGNPRIQQISVDELPLSGDFTLLAGQRNTQRVTLPKESYADGTVTLTVRRTDGATAGAMINEIALEEVTQQPPPYCQVTGTPNYTIAYGDVTINGQPAPVDTIVTAENPRGDVVGCFVVTSSGQYGFMSIFGEDTSSSPSIPGMRTGEPVLFRVNGAIAVPSAQLYWQDDKSRHRINLDGSLPPKQYLLLRPNWNLISTRLTPPVPLLELVFQSIASKYCLVLGQTGIYDCNVPASFRGLREVAPGQGYYLKVDGNAGINLVIEGTPVAANTAIRLQKGLNWIGYLPAVKLPVATALQSIADDLLQVTDGLARTYAPGDIGFNTLTEMTPGAGYLIHVSEAVTLTYPMTDTGQSAAGDSSERPGVLDGVSCAGVEATPQFMLLYGRLTLDGVGVAVGDQVEAVTPRGEVAGCFTVTTAGQYGFMPLFGSDNSLPGFQPGEPIMLRVNGAAVTLPAPLFWQDDKSTHRLDLGGDAETISTQIYLPYTSR